MGGGNQETAKRLLNNAVLKILSFHSNRLSKGDISYAVNDVKSSTGQVMKQATVSIVCLDNPSVGTDFVGETAASQSDAIENAAQVALDSIMGDPELRSQHDGAKAGRNSTKRPAPQGGAPLKKSPGLQGAKEASKRQQGGAKPKQDLNNAVLRIINPNRLLKGDIEYSTQAVFGGHQSTVNIGCLPNGPQSIAGECCPTEMAAMESAAHMALDSIMGDSELKGLHDRKKSRKA